MTGRPWVTATSAALGAATALLGVSQGVVAPHEAGAMLAAAGAAVGLGRKLDRLAGYAALLRQAADLADAMRAAQDSSKSATTPLDQARRNPRD